MFAKFIRSLTEGADKRARDAQDTAAATLRKLEAAAQKNAEKEGTALRGSGSWDTDYQPAQQMKPLPRAAAEPAIPGAPKHPVRVAIFARPLMGEAQMALFRILHDRLEAEAPDMTIHAQVPLAAFLHVDRRAAQADQDAAHAGFATQRVDLLILNDAGLPIVAVDVIGNSRNAGPKAEAKAAALQEAGVGYVTSNELTPAGDVWTQVYQHIALEIDDAGDDDTPSKGLLGSAL
jgi:hypothetical protein